MGNADLLNPAQLSAEIKALEERKAELEGVLAEALDTSLQQRREELAAQFEEARKAARKAKAVKEKADAALERAKNKYEAAQEAQQEANRQWLMAQSNARQIEGFIKAVQ